MKGTSRGCSVIEYTIATLKESMRTKPVNLPLTSFLSCDEPWCRQSQNHLVVGRYFWQHHVDAAQPKRRAKNAFRHSDAIWNRNGGHVHNFVNCCSGHLKKLDSHQQWSEKVNAPCRGDKVFSVVRSDSSVVM
jgi:hypothetical protein